MSQSSVPAQTPFAGSAPFGSKGGDYRLSDDLAKLCLPQEFRDSYRRLAWVNSICFLFLVIGLVGVKPPKIHVRPLSELQENVPVVFTPPEEQPKVEPEVKPDEPQPQDTQQDTPQVVQVIAAINSPSVAFAVPVQGAVAIASEARLATPPPPHPEAPPQAVRFNPNVSDGGSYPKPEYPGFALRNHVEGTVIVEILVDGNGAITDAKLQRSSGSSALDTAALDVVKKRWHFPATGQPRWLYWPCTFKLE
jgi:protein TonB